MKSIDQAWTMIFQQRKISWNQLVNDCYTCKTFVKSINSMKEVFLCIFSVKSKIFFHVIEKTREINITDFTKEFNFKLDTHSVEKYYKTRSRKKFRETNSLVTSLVKTLISQKKKLIFFSVQIVITFCSTFPHCVSERPGTGTRVQNELERHFHDFSIAYIWREISFRDFRSAKYAILTPDAQTINCLFHFYICKSLKLKIVPSSPSLRKK